MVGIKVNPHKKVRLGPKVVAAPLGIAQTVGNIEDRGKERPLFWFCAIEGSAIAKTPYKAAHEDSKSTAGGVKINILPLPESP